VFLVRIRETGEIDMKWRIVLFDAYTLALQGIFNTIKTVPDFEIVGAYTDEKDLVHCLANKQVDIAVINVMLKSSMGLELIEKIKGAQKDVKIIALTETQDSMVYKRALEMGVNAFLQKDTSHSELISYIKSVGKGNAILPAFVVEENTSAILSETETNILKLIADEYTSDAIAKEYYISRRTVESHVTSICKKLGVESRIGAVREAVKLKLI
jgi:two-component system vancomycin resistance associated response regulator VraR